MMNKIDKLDIERLVFQPFGEGTKIVADKINELVDAINSLLKQTDDEDMYF